MKKFIKTVFVLALIISAGFNFAKAEKGKLYFEPTMSFPVLKGYDFPVAYYDNNQTGESINSNPVYIEHNARLLPEFKGGYILPNNKGSFDISWMHFDSEEMTDLFPTTGELIYFTSLSDANLAYGIGAVDAFWAWHKLQLTVFDMGYTSNVVSNGNWIFSFYGGLRYADLVSDTKIRYFENGGTGAGNVYIASSYKSEMMGPKIGFMSKSKVSKKVGFKTKAAFSVLAGKADFSVINMNLNEAPGNQIYTQVQAKDLLRFHPVTEIELAIFYSPWKYITLNFGYKASAWFNVMKQVAYSDDYSEQRTHESYTLTMSGFFFGTTIYFG